MNFLYFSGLYIREQFRLVTDPVNVHLFTRFTVYSHRDLIPAVVFLYKATVEVIELRFFITFRMCFFVFQPTERNVYPAVWGMDPVIISLKIRLWNLFTLQIFLWIKGIFHVFG